MKMSRRNFLQGAAGTAALTGLSRWRAWAEETGGAVRLSACDWSVGMRGELEGLDRAKEIGLNGLEISAGGPGDAIALADPDLRKAYLGKSKETGIALSSVAMGFLNNAPLAYDKRGPAWLEQAIAATHDLHLSVILLAFFGLGDLRAGEGLKEKAVNTVVDRLKVAAPMAEKAGVILGLENTLSGKDNLAILDRVQSDAVRIYYDIGNSTLNGYDVPKELRELGDRICQIHFKDPGYYLGEGKVAMEPVRDAIKDMGYTGWIVLETSCPSKDLIADFKRNAAYTRELLASA